MRDYDHRMDPGTEFVEPNAHDRAVVRRVPAGIDVVLTRDGRHVARIEPVSAEEAAPPPSPRPRRKPGILKHLVGPAPEGAFDPLSEEELALWYADIPAAQK